MHIPDKKRKKTNTGRFLGICLPAEALAQAGNLEFGNSAPRSRRGAGLIEVVIAAAILVMIVAGIVSVYRLLIKSSREVIRATQAALLAEEGLEAVRVLRDTDWSTIASSTAGTSYTLAWTGTTWSMTETPALIDDIFDRRVVFSLVYRDGDDKIAPSGTLDPDTYRADVTVSWDARFATTTRMLSTYVGNIFE